MDVLQRQLTGTGWDGPTMAPKESPALVPGVWAVGDRGLVGSCPELFPANGSGPFRF